MLTELLTFIPYWLKMILLLVTLGSIVIPALNVVGNRLDAWKKLKEIEDEFAQKQLRCELHAKHEELIDVIEARRENKEPRALIAEVV